MKALIPLPILLMTGCGLGLVPVQTDKVADSGLVGDTADADADADTDTDTDTDSDADADTDTDTDTDPVDPEPPDLSSVDITSDDDWMTVSFQVSDVDNDLIGGQVMMTVDGVSYAYNIPGDLDQWNPGGESLIKLPLEACESGTRAVSVQVVDAGGLGSTTINKSHTLSSSGYFIDDSYATDHSDDYTAWGDGVSLGTVATPAKMCGHTYAASNDGTVYTGDLDFIEIVPAATGPVTFTLEWDKSGGDYDIVLMDTAFAWVAYDTTEAYGGPESFSTRLTAGTRYIIRVAGRRGAAGSWTLTLN